MIEEDVVALREALAAAQDREAGTQDALDDVRASAQGYLADRDRLARRVAELENRLNTDSQDFEIRCRRETERVLRERVAELKARLQRAAFVAEHLMMMIPPDQWRRHGAEWQGQYEGDHHAEQVAEEIESWKT